MSFTFRSKGKKVIYNDILKSFQLINQGLLQSTESDRIDISSLSKLLEITNKTKVSLVLDNYSNVYFFEDECQWIDSVIHNISICDYEDNIKGLLFFALCQVCLEKQPFNTFHGSFLKLRLKKRSTYQSWDIPMSEVFIETIKNVNQYLETINSKTQEIPIFSIPASKAKPENFSNKKIDLIYLDPPFIGGGKRSKKSGNYFKSYHVLEALADYEFFSKWIDITHPLKIPKQNHPTMEEFSNWLDTENFLRNLEQVISRFQDSHIVLSYRDDSNISVNSLLNILHAYKNNIKMFKKPHRYIKSKKKIKFNDVLIIGR